MKRLVLLAAVAAAAARRRVAVCFYCAELVTNAFRLTPSARRRDAPDSLLNSSKACLTHYNGPSKHFWRTSLT